MELTTFWFIIIAVLWIGYFVLEGFDFGVGVLLKTVAKTQAERRAVLTTLGPLWDGNEVWLLVAGGATFAAFPEWYATLFSGFYLPLFLILMALIVRGVAMEYRSKYGDAKWRARWDNAIMISSFVPALLWGVAFANIVRGVPLEVQNNVIEYTGGFFNLLNPYGLLGGLVTLSVFMTHGAIFLALKTEGAIRERARTIATKVGLFAAVVTVAFLAITVTAYNDKLEVYGLAAIVAVAWLAALGSNLRGREGYAFLYSSIALAFAVITLFTALYPNVMPSSLLESASLTINNASSTPYTLKVMTYVAVVLTPIVLLYQGWTYWVFRKRISAAQIPTPEEGVLDFSKLPK
ncbi:MAG: cytochrome d ubiquinol oxidase subunit II [Candidatus Nanopelagicaceae bacterium]|nr:cytochrome d ubiquinol oxidase subunit II [Candidatus Nanopelagicaceae bacterium]